MATSQPAVPTNETPAAKAQGLYKRAITLHQKGNLSEAIKGYALAIRLTPRSFEIYNNLGVALRASRRPQAALACFRRSLSLSPGSTVVYTNMGNALHDLGEYTRAVQAHLRAVNNAPKSAKAFFSAGLALADVGRTKDASEHFKQAMDLQKNFPAARLHHGKALLRMGDWTAGFNDFDARFDLKNHDPLRQNIELWDGHTSLLDKTILINYEGSEGTLVQYLRFMRVLKKMGARVLIESPPHFNQLLSVSPDVDGTPNLGAPVENVDVQIPLLSLPRVLGIQVDNIPDQDGYLPIPKFSGQTLNISDDVRLVVGLVWSSEWSGRSNTGPAHPANASLEDLAELFGISDIQLISLELGQGTKDISDLGFEPLIDQAGSSIMDVGDMAGIIEQLDLVICVDSVAAHIAGAMGKPVWVLTRPGADWCWLENRDDSPWYSSMTHFRKDPDDTWSDVASALRLALTNALKGAA